MKNILIILILIFLNNCTGYKPIFSSGIVNFYIGEIVNENNDKLTKKIIKKLNPYTSESNKKEINMSINSLLDEKIISKDSKGDPLVYEIKIIMKIKLIENEINIKEFKYLETFTYNNQSNKFELNQYKKNIENNLVDKIFEKLILQLRLI